MTFLSSVKKPTWQFIVGFVVLALAVATLGVQLVNQLRYGELSDKQSLLIECNRQYTNEFADAIDARAAANERTQLAMDEFVSSIGDAMEFGTTTERIDRINQAVAAYEEDRATSKTEIANNPYPAPPRKFCEELLTLGDRDLARIMEQ